MLHFLYKHNFFSINQHGFLLGQGLEDTIHDYTADLKSCLDTQYITSTIFLDMA